MRKNVAGQHVAFQMISTTDGSDVTTGTPTVYYTIDAGTQGTGGGAKVSEGNGQWSYAPAQAETNGNHVAFTMVLAGAVSQTSNQYPVAFDPSDAVRLGITALPNAAADAAGGLAISDAGGLDLDTKLANTNEITSARLSELDAVTAGKMANQVDVVEAKTSELTFTVANQVDTNVLDWNSGTGFTGDTYPSTQSQVDGIGAASGGALNFQNEGDNVDAAIKGIVFDGVETSGTNVSIDFEDATYHQIDDVTNNIDIVYQFDIGGARSVTELTWKGALIEDNDVATIQVYNGVSWDTVGTIVGTKLVPTSTADNSILVIPLFSSHTGIGADLGKVFVRIECVTQSNPTLYTDQMYVSAVNIGQSMGYIESSAVHINTVSGIAGTETYVNGTADNPVDTLTDATTIASALVGIHRFSFSTNSSWTLITSLGSSILTGHGWALALGGQDISNSHIFDASVSGIATGTSEAHFHTCAIGAVTIPPCHLISCALDNTITLIAGTYTTDQCFSEIAGANTPSIDFGATTGNTDLSMRHYSGGIEVKNYNALGTDNMSLEGDGQLIINANCTGGTIHIRGNFKVTDNSGGAVSIVYDNATTIITDIETHLVDIKGTGFVKDTHSLTSLLAATDTIGITKNETFSNMPINMVDATDFATPETGITVSGSRSIDGAAFAALDAGSSILEVGFGVYSVDLVAADTNGDTIIYRFTGTGCADTLVPIKTRT